MHRDTIVVAVLVVGVMHRDTIVVAVLVVGVVRIVSRGDEVTPTIVTSDKLSIMCVPPTIVTSDKLSI